MTTRDDYVLNESMNNMNLTNNFNRKMYHIVQDNNNSTYSNNQIYFQLSNIYNLNKYYDWSNALLILPVVIEVVSNKDLLTTGEIVALKNNLHLINSMVMSVNQKIVHQTTNNINEYLNFVKLSEITKNTLEGYEYLNFIPEDSNLLKTKYAFGYDGSGIPNKLINNIANFDSFKSKTDKMEGVGVATYGNQFLKNGVKSQYIDNVDRNTTLKHSYEYICYIKLSDISDFFKEVGMAKLFVDQLTLHMNMGKSSFKYTAAVAGGNLSSINADTLIPTFNATEESNLYQFNTCPFYVNNTGALLSVPSAINDTISFEIKLSNSMKKNCEIYIPGFELMPEIENSFISTPLREFYFKDVYQTFIQSIDANSNFSLKLNNAISNALGVLIIPYIASNHTESKFITSSCQNIEPNTPTIGCSLKNLNVIVGGTQLLLKSADYNYEHFLSNLENGNINVVNGGYNLEQSSLNLRKWNYNHKYYYFNCNNLPKVENISQNVELTGLNDNNFKLTMSVFIIYNKKCVINRENGNIIEMV